MLRQQPGQHLGGQERVARPVPGQRGRQVLGPARRIAHQQRQRRAVQGRFVLPGEQRAGRQPQ
ncbi:hypothetical protein OU787_22795 [Kitasatospora sp. YST-16]|uniref:hypothetical protein n=1 Tax=Kitasatospora sp. YST-16 TaxID=2998080 RepID=UPI002283D1F0|nr:hypothetical protein [Kitasatospora sp. YST-16]WAL74076.1 hypothetical protein OU787_22795 [Kitasatospora sp. YST-16]